ncbi:hypothetical protein M3Y94_00835300 [Aphelenchoides besseyi]|nr:hypothetical protein M3Y94_00835300 [Aphelenchoides besseyi]
MRLLGGIRKNLSDLNRNHRTYVVDRNELSISRHYFRMKYRVERNFMVAGTFIKLFSPSKNPSVVVKALEPWARDLEQESFYSPEQPPPLLLRASCLVAGAEDHLRRSVVTDQITGNSHTSGCEAKRRHHQ